MPGWDDFLKENGLAHLWNREEVARYNGRAHRGRVASLFGKKVGGTPSPHFQARLNSDHPEFSKKYRLLLAAGALPEQIEVYGGDRTTE